MGEERNLRPRGAAKDSRDGARRPAAGELQREAGNDIVPLPGADEIDPGKALQDLGAHRALAVGPAEEDRGAGVRVLEQAREGQGSGVLLEGGREADRAVSPPVPGPEAFLEERARRREVALESGEVLEAEALEGNQHLLDVALGFPLGPREQ